MTNILQSVDPMHTAYLDWRLFMRNLVACCVPSLPVLSAEQLLQLEQRMREVDSNADGLLTRPELLSVDMQPLFVAATGAPEPETGSSWSADGGGAAASDGDAAAEGQQTHEGENAAAAPLASDGEVANGANGLREEASAPLKQLLWLMFANSSAAIDIEEVLLYCCCAVDGAEGLQKAFAVLTGSQLDGQVRVLATSDAVLSGLGGQVS